MLSYTKITKLLCGVFWGVCIVDFFVFVMWVSAFKNWMLAPENKMILSVIFLITLTITGLSFITVHWHRRRCFKKIFGLYPPRSSKDFQGMRVIQPFVDKVLKDLKEKKKAVEIEEDKLLEFKMDKRPVDVQAREVFARSRPFRQYVEQAQEEFEDAGTLALHCNFNTRSVQ